MDEMHLNRTISVSPQGRLFINNQEVDFDMFLIEVEAINLLEEELMEGRSDTYNTEEEVYPLIESELNQFSEDDYSIDDEDIFFEGGCFDINSDDFDVNY